MSKMPGLRVLCGVAKGVDETGSAMLKECRIIELLKDCMRENV